ncbi:MAG: histidine--tRNA ligase [Actinomycetota bacterium]
MVTFSTPKAPKGAPDIVPPRSAIYERVEAVASERFRRYGYRRIETPAFEHTELFERGLASGSDIVTKEMYTFEDKGGRSLTLRPDMTAPVVRALLENRLDKVGLPVKLYYVAPIFRHERPQAGRYRQFRQAGVELVGATSPEADAEVIELASSVFRSLGLTQVSLLLNSIGHAQCRALYLPRLVQFLEAHRGQLCEDCQRKIERNPLRTFDCKVEQDQKVMLDAPLITDSLCSDCKSHHDAVKSLLTDVGVAFIEEPRLVRGLDYYSRTTFEFTSQGLGSQNAIGAGGRYDGLAELLGGDDLPGIGFGLGVDRIVMLLEEQPQAIRAFVVAVGEEARRAAFALVTRLREAGVSVDFDASGRGMKAQFKMADRLGAEKVVIIGEREIATGLYAVKDMVSGEQETIEADGVGNHLKEQP